MRCSQRIALRLHDGAQRFGDVARFDQREPLRRADLILALLRDDACFKAQTVHLAEPLGKMVHAAQLARQADFADGGDMVADGLVEIARRQRQHGGKIRRRLVHAESADDVQERVTAGHLERAALFEHRHQHGGAVVVKAVACPPRD